MVKAKLSGKHLAYQNWWDGNFGHFLDTYKYIVRLSRRVPPSKKKKFILSELRNTGVLNRTCSVFGSNESVFLMVRTSLHLHCSWEKMYQLFFLLLFFINHQDKHL